MVLGLTSWFIWLLFSCSVMSNSLWPHGLQHARLPCPSLPPRVCSNSCPLSQWCHLTILSSVAPFSCLRSFPMSHLFASGGQSIRASALVLSMNIQAWFSLELTGWISLWFKGLSRVFSNATVQNHQFFAAQPSLWSNSHIHTHGLVLIWSSLYFSISISISAFFMVQLPHTYAWSGIDLEQSLFLYLYLYLSSLYFHISKLIVSVLLTSQGCCEDPNKTADFIRTEAQWRFRLLSFLVYCCILKT